MSTLSLVDYFRASSSRRAVVLTAVTAVTLAGTATVVAAQEYFLKPVAAVRLPLGNVDGIVAWSSPQGDSSIYITGRTSQPGQATPGAFQGAIAGEEDAYVAKLDGETLAVEWLTYFGGSFPDRGARIVLGPEGTVIVAGHTYSPDLPVTSNAGQAIHSSPGSQDLFLAVFSGDGGDLVYSTYLGGDGDDQLTGMQSDGARLYLTGVTNSSDLPVTANAFQAELGTVESIAAGPYRIGFLMRLSANGRETDYLTYFGGDGFTAPLGLAVQSSGEVWIGGTTFFKRYDGFLFAENLPTTPGAFDTNLHECSSRSFAIDFLTDYCTGFLARFNTDSGALTYSTYLGGNGGAAVLSLAAVGETLYIGGVTGSSDFPITTWAWRPTQNPEEATADDGFLIKYNTTQGLIEFSTFVGGCWGDAVGSGAGFGFPDDAVVDIAILDGAVTVGFCGRDFDYRDAALDWTSKDGRSRLDRNIIAGTGHERARAVEGVIAPQAAVPGFLFVAGEASSATITVGPGYYNLPSAGGPLGDVFLVRYNMLRRP